MDPGASRRFHGKTRIQDRRDERAEDVAEGFRIVRERFVPGAMQRVLELDEIIRRKRGHRDGLLVLVQLGFEDASVALDGAQLEQLGAGWDRDLAVLRDGFTREDARDAV